MSLLSEQLAKGSADQITKLFENVLQVCCGTAFSCQLLVTRINCTLPYTATGCDQFLSSWSLHVLTNTFLLLDTFAHVVHEKRCRYLPTLPGRM